MSCPRQETFGSHTALFSPTRSHASRRNSACHPRTDSESSSPHRSAALSCTPSKTHTLHRSITHKVSNCSPKWCPSSTRPPPSPLFLHASNQIVGRSHKYFDASSVPVPRGGVREDGEPVIGKWVREENHDRRTATSRGTAFLSAQDTNDESGSWGRKVLQCQSIVACYHPYRQPIHKHTRTEYFSSRSPNGDPPGGEPKKTYIYT